MFTSSEAVGTPAGAQFSAIDHPVGPDTAPPTQTLVACIGGTTSFFQLGDRSYAASVTIAAGADPSGVVNQMSDGPDGSVEYRTKTI